MIGLVIAQSQMQVVLQAAELTKPGLLCFLFSVLVCPLISFSAWKSHWKMPPAGDTKCAVICSLPRATCLSTKLVGVQIGWKLFLLLF